MRPLPAPHWRIIENATVVPPKGDGRPQFGAFDAAGHFCPETRTLLSHGHLSHAPDLPKDVAAHRPGTHFYGGLGRMHFGHFLLESATRFWALDDLDEPPESVLFLPLAKADMRTALNAALRELYAGLTGALPAQVIKAPVRVERLIVAQQGFGHGDWIAGTPRFQSFVAKCFADSPPYEGPEKIYLSRRGLKETHQHVDQEDALEARLEDAGYTIVHPERFDLGTQIELYRAARVILGGDGSAFHLMAFVLQPGTRVGLIQRRNRPEMIERLTRQIAAFSGISADTFDPTLPLDEQRKRVPKGVKAPVPLDLNALLKALETAGYL